MVTEWLFSQLSPDDFSGEMSHKAAVVIFEIFREKKGIYLPDIIASTRSRNEPVHQRDCDEKEERSR